MTFVEALKRLAEKEPERFQFREYEANKEMFDYSFLGKNEHGNFVAFVEARDETQDVLDRILALIGWEYEVKPKHFSSGTKWNYGAWNRGGGVIKFLDTFDQEDEANKLSAAKAALIAVVEHQYPKE